MKIFGNLLCHRRRQHTGIGTRIGNKFFLVKFLNYGKSFIWTDFKQLRTFVLQFGKVEEQRRIFFLLLFLDIFDNALITKTFHKSHALFGILFFLKTILLKKFWRIEVMRTLHSLPIGSNRTAIFAKSACNSVIWRFYKLAYFTFAAHHHTQHAGHNATHGNHHVFVGFKVIFEGIAILDGKYTRKIYTHKIIFLSTKIRRIRKRVVSIPSFCLLDAAKNLLLGLRIDPNTSADFFGWHVSHLIYKTIDIFTLASRVGANIYTINIGTCKLLFYNIKLFLHRWNNLIKKLFWYKGQSIYLPTF